MGLHLDNTISLPPLWLGLPAPKPLARGGVSWGQFGLNPACAHPPLLLSDIRVTFLSRTLSEDPSHPHVCSLVCGSVGIWSSKGRRDTLETSCLSFPPPQECCPPKGGQFLHSFSPPSPAAPSPAPPPPVSGPRPGGRRMADVRVSAASLAETVKGQEQRLGRPPALPPPPPALPKPALLWL